MPKKTTETELPTKEQFTIALLRKGNERMRKDLRALIRVNDRQSAEVRKLQDELDVHRLRERLSEEDNDDGSSVRQGRSTAAPEESEKG